MQIGVDPRSDVASPSSHATTHQGGLVLGSQENRPEPNLPDLHRIAHEHYTGDPAEDHLRRLARRIVAHEKAAKAKADRAQLARDRARAEVDSAWHGEA